MSYEYHDETTRAGFQLIAILYLIFGIICLLCFFGGICALCCCCNRQFRGIERRGYVLHDAQQNAPLLSVSFPIQPAGNNPMQPSVPMQPYPGEAPQGPGWVAPNYPPMDPPPKY